MKSIIKPKKDWIQQFKDNRAISDVIWGVQDIDGKKSIGWVGLTPSTKPFSDFMNEAQKEVFINDIMLVQNFHYDEIVQYAHQNTEYKVKKISLYASDFIAAYEEYGKLLFAPYDDGVMLYGINIKPELRGKGIGTNIMNKLYDISEQMNIPIYLIPYPDDNFRTKNEKKLIDRLKKYYSRLEFGPVSENSLVWSNME